MKVWVRNVVPLWRDRLAMSWLVVKESVLSFADNRGFHMAATLAHYGFLSLMPLILVAVFILGRILRSSEDVLAAAKTVTSELFPTFNEAILNDLVALAQAQVWGVIGVVLLLWSMTPFAGAMRSAIYGCFKADHQVHFLKAKLLDLLAVLLVLLMFVVLAVRRMLFSFSDVAFVPGWLYGPLASAWQFGVTVLLLAFYYRVFSPLALRTRHLLGGALVAATLLALVRPLFVLLLKYNPNYGYAFGSLKAIFVLIIWVYYSFVILLFGAEFMANVRRREALFLKRLFRAGSADRMNRHPLAQRFERLFADGETIFREGEAGAEMYYIADGGVALSIRGQPLRTLQPGEYFGEMSMLLDAPRSATATAAGDTRLLAVSRGNFDLILRENPDTVKAILEEMARRLRDMDQRKT